MIPSIEFINKLKNYTKIRKKLAFELSVNEKTIQTLIDSIIHASQEESNGIITEEDLLTILLRKEDDEESIRESIFSILKSLDYVISSNNTLFKITKTK